MTIIARRKIDSVAIRGPILLTIIDHFSKYGWIYCIPDKSCKILENFGRFLKIKNHRKSMDTVFLKIKQAFAQFMPTQDFTYW